MFRAYVWLLRNFYVHIPLRRHEWFALRLPGVAIYHYHRMGWMLTFRLLRGYYSWNRVTGKWEAF